MLASSSCGYWWLGLSCFQILQSVILNNVDPIYPWELFDHFCLEYLVGCCDTQRQSFVSIIAPGRSKGSQFFCLLVQLAMPESTSYAKFAKFYCFFFYLQTCVWWIPSLVNGSGSYQSVSCLMVWGQNLYLNIYRAFRCVFFWLYSCWAMFWVLPVTQLYCPSSSFLVPV